MTDLTLMCKWHAHADYYIEQNQYICYVKWA
jgi:hypothetical protein